MMLGLLSLLLAADPSAYPYVAEVQAPASGIVGLQLPPDVVGRWGEDLNRTLLYLSPSGESVAYTTVQSKDRLTRDNLDSFVRSQGGGTYGVSAFARPVDALILQVGRDALVWQVQVMSSGGGWTNAGIVWKMAGGSERMVVPVPPGEGPFVLKVTALDGSDTDIDDVMGIELAALTPPLTREFVEVGEPVVTEEGTAQYTVILPGIRHVRGLGLHVNDDLYRRILRAEGASTVVERVNVGGYSLEQNDLNGLDLRTDRFVLEVDTDRGDPLDIKGVDVFSTSAMLLARNPGPGQLYVGSLEPLDAYDLEFARNALLLSGLVPASMTPPVPNPGWVPPPTREGIDEGFQVAERLPQRWERDLVGEPGWVRVPVDATVLGRAQWDLQDLRVVDSEGRLVPYLLRPGQQVGEPEDLVFTRQEVGNITELRAPVPQGTPIRSVELTTDRSVFERLVEVVRDRGATVQTLRAVNWAGTERGRRLSLRLDQDIGAELMIRIHNYENPPIRIEQMRISRPERELLVRIPEGGAKLVYGARRVSPPQFDLELLTAEVLKMPVGTATLGPEQQRGKPALTGTDRVASGGAMFLLAMGLVGMTWRVLKGAKEEDAVASPPKNG